MLSLIPARFSVSVLFIVACFVSVAMGTSVGTITLLTPIAAAVSTASGFDLAFCVASVMGGAMFGTIFLLFQIRRLLHVMVRDVR